MSKPGAESNISDEKYKWRALTTIAIGTFMAPLDGSIVNVTLPHISNDFGVGLPTAGWVVMSYLLMISSLLLTWGRLGDMLGHKKVYITGFAIFTLGSLLCALSPTIWALIAFRSLQAVGAGMMMAIGPALVTSIFAPHERGRALGIIGSTVATALALGPVLGGLLVSYFSWRAIFLINIPIGIYNIYQASKVLKPSICNKSHRFDIPGAVTAFLTLITFLLAASHGQQWGWSSPVIIGLFISSLVFLCLFVYIESRVSHPMMDLALFKIRLFTMANISSLISFTSHFSVIFLMPFYLTQLRGLEPAIAGLVLAASPLMILLVAPLSGALSDRMGSRILSSFGLAMVSTALLLLSTLQPETDLLYIAGFMALLGLGIGLFQSPNNSAIMGSVPRNRLGIASGTLASMRNIGMVMGVALAGAIFTTRMPMHLENHLIRYAQDTAQSLAFTSAMHDVFVTCSMLAAVGVLTSLVRGKQVSSKCPDTRKSD